MNAFLFLATLSCACAALVFYVPLPIAAELVLLLLLLGYSIVAMLRPRAALCAFLVLLPLGNNIGVMRYTGYFPPALVLFLFFLAGWAGSRLVRAESFPPRRVPVPVILIAILGALSGVITLLRYSEGVPFTLQPFLDFHVNLFLEDKSTALREVFATTIVFLSGPAMLWAAVDVLRTREDWRRACTAVAVGLAGVALFGVWQSLGHVDVWNTPHFASRGQINSTLIDPNALGLYLFLSLPLLGMLFLESKSRAARVAVAMLGVALLYVLAHSGSRTGMAALFLVTVLLTARLLWHHRHSGASVRALVRPRIVMLVAIGIAILMIFMVSGPFRDSALGRRMAQTAEIVRERGPLGLMQADRHELWGRAIVVWRHYPVTGVGLGAYKIELPNLLEWYFPEYRDNAANYYLQFAVEMGAIGLLLVLVMWGVIVRDAWRLVMQPATGWREAYSRSVPLAVLLVMLLMFITGPHTNPVDVKLLFWLILAMIYAEQPFTSPARTMRCVPIVAGGILLLVFTCIFAWQSATTLSVKHQVRRYGIPGGAGFHAPEYDDAGNVLAWTGRHAWFPIPAEARAVRLTLFAGHPDAAEHAVRVRVLVDEQLVHEQTFTDPAAAVAIEFAIPPLLLPYGLLTIDVDRTWQPSACIPENTDDRQLGVLVSQVHILRH